MPEADSHISMGDPTASMHVHTTHDGHHYLVDGPAETCPAHATSERIIVQTTDEHPRARGVTVKALVAVAVTIALVAAVRRLGR